jgi:hypothetical protein
MKWMAQDNRIDQEILYWISKFILMRGDKPLSERGAVSHQFRALAESQDLIGWRDFTKGYISTHFYAIQSFHLTMLISHLNGEVWTKQFISKLLQLTHSQWILKINFTDLSGFHIKAQKYWILAVNAARMARDLELAKRRRAK